MNLQANAIIVNQNMPSRTTEIYIKNKFVRVINTPEKGLSKSRNMLLRNAQGDICQLCDDDIEFRDDHKDIVLQAYNELPEADIICFRFSEKRDIETRTYFKKITKINLINLSKVSSVEITFRRKSILKADLYFDTLLGLGSLFPSGEENAFLADAIRSGLNIYHVPKTICYTKPITDFARIKNKSGFDEDYFRMKGACFYRIYKRLFLPFCIFFLVSKKTSIFKDVSMIKALHWMHLGYIEYKTMIIKK
jgi:glycosyltransferase involved in cell wall biosynthesis